MYLYVDKKVFLVYNKLIYLYYIFREESLMSSFAKITDFSDRYIFKPLYFKLIMVNLQPFHICR